MRLLGAALYGGLVFGAVYWLYGMMRTDMPTGRLIDLF
jgi:hypothetical protein